MYYEYTGWVSLASSVEEWSDEDFEKAFNEVKNLATEYTDDGHEFFVPIHQGLPTTVFMKGSSVEDLVKPLELMKRISGILDVSWGELSVYDYDSEPEDKWNDKYPKRYVLINGKVDVLK